MSTWFRFYNEALDDPKVQRLDPVIFKHWVNLLCLACRFDGKLPSNQDIAFNLRIDEIALESLLDRLLIATLIDVRKGGPNGSYIAIHGWDKRQYKSDTSTDRVKRYRERYRERFKTVSETTTETETESETEKEVKSSDDDRVTPQDILEGWNEIAVACGLPKAGKLTGGRLRQAQARLREYPDIEDWKAALSHVRQTPFLRGENDRGWRADIDFFLQAKSFTKLVEGSYGKTN